MRYVDAGYAICLSVLFLYAASLMWRRRRLARAVMMAEPHEAAHPGPGPTSTGGATAAATEVDR